MEAISTQGKVFEIGPGLGALTYLLQKKANQLVLFEIDRGFVQILSDFFPSVEIVQGDALKTIPDYVKSHFVPDAIVSNLPYNVGAHIIGMLIQNQILAKSMVFTLQKEVVLRMLSKVGSKDYSVFTLMCELDYNLKKVMDINGASFYPVPNVASSVVALTLKEDRVCHGVSLDDKKTREIYFRLAHTLFASRRKTVKNNLEREALKFKIGKEQLFEAALNADIPLDARGEEIGYKNIWHCATLISSFN